MSYLTPQPGYSSEPNNKMNTTPQSDPTGLQRTPMLRDTLYRAPSTKICYFYKDGDPLTAGLKVAINHRSYNDLDILQTDLSRKLRGLPFGCRSIYTPRGHDQVRSVGELEHGGHYVCSTHRSYAHGLDVENAKKQQPRPWHGGRVPSGRRTLNNILRFSQSQRIYPQRPRKAWKEKQEDESFIPIIKTPKKVTVVRNGDPVMRHVLLLNRRTTQSFEQVLDDLSGMFGMSCSKLYTIDGKPVSGVGRNGMQGLGVDPK